MVLSANTRIEVLHAGPLEIVPDEHLARAEGHTLMLSIRELRLLTELARRANRIMAREELFRLVWGKEMRVGDRSVDVYVRKLRVKLESALPDWLFIHTHFGFGYRLTAEPKQPAYTSRGPHDGSPTSDRDRTVTTRQQSVHN
jgi:DNA-binding response OmpR family regulator